jgi:hypothetical protein
MIIIIMRGENFVAHRLRITALIHTFISERDRKPLQCFYKRLYTIKLQLALSRLMHSIRYSSAIFPCQALENRPDDGGSNDL